jgi:hypothetical protein
MRPAQPNHQFGDRGLSVVEHTPEQSAVIDDIRHRVVSGCDAEEFAALRCPVCGSGLELDSHPRPGGAALVFVACGASTAHVGFTDRAAVAPAWWAEHRSGGWIVE